MTAMSEAEFRVWGSIEPGGDEAVDAMITSYQIDPDELHAWARQKIRSARRMANESVSPRDILIGAVASAFVAGVELERARRFTEAMGE
jgi:hypothetical protein